MVAAAQGMDAATLIEHMLAASDRAQSLLKSGDLNDEEVARITAIHKQAEGLIDLLEELLDAQELVDSLEDAKRGGTVPWDQVKAELGL